MILKVSNAVLCFLLLCTLAEILAPPAEAAQARMNLRWGSVRTAYPLFTDATNFGAFVRAFKTALKPGELVLVISRHPWQSAFKDLMTKLANVRTQLCGSPVGTGDESYCGAAKGKPDVKAAFWFDRANAIYNDTPAGNYAVCYWVTQSRPWFQDPRLDYISLDYQYAGGGNPEYGGSTRASWWARAIGVHQEAKDCITGALSPLKFATFLVSKFSSSGADDCAAPEANCWTRLGNIASLVNLQLQYAMQRCATSGPGGCTDFTRVDGEFNAALPGLAASSVEMVWPQYTINKRTPVDYHLRVANLVDNVPPIGLWPHTLNQFGGKGITHLSTWYTPNSSVALARNGSADYKFSLLNLFAAYE